MRITLSAVLAAMTLLAGCAVVQKPIPATGKLFEDKNRTIAVAVGKLPEPAMAMTGSQGILDYAINKANARAIEDRLQSHDFTMVTALRDGLSKGVEARNVKVVVVAEALDITKLKDFTEGSGEGIARADYRPLAKEYGADRLLLVTPRWLGTTRNYYSFMPTSPPQGYVSLVAQIVDLKTNRLEWYEPIEVWTTVSGEWDQAPNYENLMVSVTESTRQATAKVRSALFMEGAPATASAAGAPVVAANETAAPATK